MSEVGQRIKQLRLSLGETLEEFGNHFDTSKVTVFNWEKGRNLPNKENLKAIADLADTSVDELLYGRKLIALEEFKEQINKRIKARAPRGKDISDLELAIKIAEELAR